MGQRAKELTKRFEQAVAEFDKAIEACSDAQWRAICNAEGWTVGQTAQHVSGQFVNEMMFITAGAEGRALPGLTLDGLNELNDTRAEEHSSVTKAEVLKELRTEAANVVAYISALSDEQLDRTGTLAIAGGATVTTQQLIEGGVLIAHVTEHLDSIRKAVVPAMSVI